jgi:hypothetical protein
MKPGRAAVPSVLALGAFILCEKDTEVDVAQEIMSTRATNERHLPSGHMPLLSIGGSD